MSLLYQHVGTHQYNHAANKSDADVAENVLSQRPSQRIERCHVQVGAKRHVSDTVKRAETRICRIDITVRAISAIGSLGGGKVLSGTIQCFDRVKYVRMLGRACIIRTGHRCELTRRPEDDHRQNRVHQGKDEKRQDAYGHGDLKDNWPRSVPSRPPLFIRVLLLCW